MRRAGAPAARGRLLGIIVTPCFDCVWVCGVGWCGWGGVVVKLKETR